MVLKEENIHLPYLTMELVNHSEKYINIYSITNFQCLVIWPSWNNYICLYNLNYKTYVIIEMINMLFYNQKNMEIL